MMGKIKRNIFKNFKNKSDEFNYDEYEKSLQDKYKFKKEKKIVFILMAVAIGIYLLLNSFYIVKEDQVMVVETFGKPTVVDGAGIKLKIPFIQKTHAITKNIIALEIGYSVGNEEDINSETAYTADSLMITKDFNFVNTDFYLEVKVSDPIQAYANDASAKEIITNLAKSYIRDTVGTYNVDDVITTGKAEIQAKVKEALSKRLEEENIGYAVHDVKLQDAEPPQEVSGAFRAVEDAKQGMDTAINQANQYKAEKIPAAKAEADKLTNQAEAYKAERIAEANGQAARFNEMYTEYIKYPLITKQRMLYETIEEVLPNAEVIISDGNTSKLYPLNSFSTINNASKEEK